MESKVEKIRTFYAGEGVQLEFDNGLVLSLGFGYGHYGSNYGNEELTIMPIDPARQIEASSVEVAIIRKKDKKFVTKQSGCLKESNDVAGYVDIKELPYLIACVSSKSKETVDRW